MQHARESKNGWPSLAQLKKDWKKGPPLLFIADLGATWLEYARAQLHWFCKSICLSLPQLNARKCASRISLTRHFDGNESLAEMD